MIIDETVFILGAGASKPYGLPLGEKLVFDIIQKLDPGRKENQRLIHHVINAADEADFCTPELLEAFRNDLIDSHAESVDEFLEHQSHTVTVYDRIAWHLKLIKFPIIGRTRSASFYHVLQHSPIRPLGVDSRLRRRSRFRHTLRTSPLSCADLGGRGHLSRNGGKSSARS